MVDERRSEDGNVGAAPSGPAAALPLARRGGTALSRFLVGVLVVLTLLVGCKPRFSGGGGAGGWGGGPTPVVERYYLETFESRDLSHWRLSSPLGVAIEPIASGACLLVRDTGRAEHATLSNHVFSDAEGFRIVVEVQLPDEECQSNGPVHSSLIEILDKGEAVAGVDFVRARCGSEPLTKLIYWTKRPDLSAAEEVFATGTQPAGFLEFTFQNWNRIRGSYWARGRTRFNVGLGLPTAQRELELRLWSGAGHPGLSVRYDNVELRKFVYE